MISLKRMFSNRRESQRQDDRWCREAHRILDVLLTRGMQPGYFGEGELSIAFQDGRPTIIRSGNTQTHKVD